MRRIALMAHERSRGFRFVLADGQLDLSASNPDLGEARELLPVEYQGERFETAFNARYLLDVLGAMTAKEVAIELPRSAPRRRSGRRTTPTRSP